MSIQLWHPETSNPIQDPLIKHTAHVQPSPHSPDPQQVVVPSQYNISHLADPFSSPSIHKLFCDTTYTVLKARPDTEGWVRDTTGGLLYWVPPDYRTGLHSPALLTIPRHSPIRSVSLNFDDFAYGTRWTHIFDTAHL